MLQAGSKATGRAFGAQGQGVAVPVIKRVHFLFDDVGHFADRAFEQFGFFDDRQPNFAVTVSAENVPDALFRILPERRNRLRTLYAQ